MNKTQKIVGGLYSSNKGKTRLEKFLTYAFIFLTLGQLIEYYCTYKNLPFVLYYIVQAMSLFVALFLVMKAKIKITNYRLFYILSLFVLFSMRIQFYWALKYSSKSVFLIRQIFDPSLNAWMVLLCINSYIVFFEMPRASMASRIVIISG